MKKDIHPKWYHKAQIICSCGYAFSVGATKPQIKVDICSHCHPFYTGEMKYVDTMGRVEKFQQKQKIASKKAVEIKAKFTKKIESQEKEEKRPKTLREMLLGE